MAKMLIVSGSPRRSGNCSVLIDAFCRGASASGHAIDVVRLHDLVIRPCAACRSCKAADELDCVINDDMRPLYEKVRNAEALVIASPIYWWSLSAQTKLFLDRCDALEGPGGNVLQQKPVGVLLTHGGETAESSGAIHAMRLFESAADYIGFDLAGIVHGMAWEEGEIRGNPEVIAQAEDLGREMAARLRDREP